MAKKVVGMIKLQIPGGQATPAPPRVVHQKGLFVRIWEYLFGTGEKQKIAFLALAFVVYLLPLVVAAVDSVDDVYLKTAYTLGAGTWQTVRKVLLAISWPDIYQALRLGFGIGWSYIILAEMVDIGEPPTKGFRPVAISNRMMPRAKRSLRW